MPARRKAAVVAVLGTAPLALTALGAVPAAAHDSPDAPVSRVSRCYAEGPEHPRSADCRPAVVAAADKPAVGHDGSAPYLVMGGAAALALGSAALFGSVRRRSGSDDRHER